VRDRTQINNCSKMYKQAGQVEHLKGVPVINDRSLRIHFGGFSDPHAINFNLCLSSPHSGGVFGLKMS
jgi:hypothetical protein